MDWWTHEVTRLLCLKYSGDQLEFSWYLIMQFMFFVSEQIFKWSTFSTETCLTQNIIKFKMHLSRNFSVRAHPNLWFSNFYFLGDIGGNMGMFLGMSVITITEICLFFSKMFWLGFSKKRRDYMYSKRVNEKV